VKTLNVLGMDYGAGSGRAIAGKYDGNKLVLEEIHRFQHNPINIFAGSYLNIFNLFGELKNSLKKAKAADIKISAVGIDAWASDFGLIDSQGNLLGNPHYYRDNNKKSFNKSKCAVMRI